MFTTTLSILASRAGVIPNAEFLAIVFLIFNEFLQLFKLALLLGRGSFFSYINYLGLPSVHPAQDYVPGHAVDVLKGQGRLVVVCPGGIYG